MLMFIVYRETPSRRAESEPAWAAAPRARSPKCALYRRAPRIPRYSHRCVRQGQKCIVLRRAGDETRGDAAASTTATTVGEYEGEGEEPPLLSYMDAALEGTLAALLEGALAAGECADAMVLAVHRLLADGRCDRARALVTL